MEFCKLSADILSPFSSFSTKYIGVSITDGAVVRHSTFGNDRIHRIVIVLRAVPAGTTNATATTTAAAAVSSFSS
jgi:hypothetical protein